MKVEPEHIWLLFPIPLWITMIITAISDWRWMKKHDPERRGALR